MRHLVEIDDLDDSEVVAVLDRAGALADGVPTRGRDHFVAGLFFTTASLRTRVGFATAVSRLGGTPITITELRYDDRMSAPESFDDALRTVTGMSDVAVVRTSEPLTHERLSDWAACPVVNGGDASGHPTQALIDLFAIERLVGPIREQTVALLGDLTMRASRSLLRLFNRFPPARLVCVAPPSRRGHGVDLGDELRAVTEVVDVNELGPVDVLHVTGLPPRRGAEELDVDSRRPYGVTADLLDRLGSSVVVLSPMPVVDEIDDDVKRDPRVRIFAASDLAVSVRAAVIELLLAGRHPGP